MAVLYVAGAEFNRKTLSVLASIHSFAQQRTRALRGMHAFRPRLVGTADEMSAAPSSSSSSRA